MKQQLHLLSFSSLIFGVFLSFQTSCAAAEIWHTIPDNKNTAMEKFSPNIRTHCLGRYLIDLPIDLGDPRISTAFLYFGLGANFKKVELKMPGKGDLDRATFESKVNARREELYRTQQSEVGKSLLLDESNMETIYGQAFLLRRHTDRHGQSLSTTSELHVLVGTQYVILETESFPPTMTRRAGKLDGYEFVDPTADETRLRHVAKHLRIVTDFQHGLPGFCILNVVIDKDALGYDEERADVVFYVEKNKLPKVVLQIGTRGKYGYEDTPMHERLQALVDLFNGELKDEGTLRVLRKRDRSIGGMQFQEWAQEIYAREYATTDYGFLLQAMPPEKSQMSFTRPAIAISLEVGSHKKGNSSAYGLEEVEQNWDKWLNSLRLSPVNVGR